MFHGVLSLLIVIAAVLSYVTWLRWFSGVKAPPMVMPHPYVYEEAQPVTAVLLWQEELILSPVAGEVQLPRANTIAKVGKDETVATILYRGRTQSLRAPEQGYFIPAWDGVEGSWSYSEIWPGSELLPSPPPLRWVPNLSELSRDLVVGKLLPLPQKVRAIFYADLTPSLYRDLKRGYLDFRLDPQGATWRASVRVFLALSEQKVKVAVELPFFPPDLVESRTLSLLVCAGESDGVLIPESSVVLKDGTYGVYELLGDRLIFRPITGRPLERGMFFASSGLKSGNPVILNGHDAAERRVQLW